jgi:hypothetical protein
LILRQEIVQSAKEQKMGFAHNEDRKFST